MNFLTQYFSREDAKQAKAQRDYFILKLLALFVLNSFNSFAQTPPRKSISLNNDWYSIATSDNKVLPSNTWSVAIGKQWTKVNVPHNWDAYEGYRRKLHGNRHGDSWYKKTFTVKQRTSGKRFFLFFEGVGSYATVYLNGKKVGSHAGGRTTFTIDVTSVVKTDGTLNQLAVRAYHPSHIKDLPWVCGGCSDERGFSEGSQPMGIFRPVQLIITSDVRIEPFGVHAWAAINNNTASLSINTTLKNYSGATKKITLIHQLADAKGTVIKEISAAHSLKAKDSIVINQKDITIDRPTLWALDNPYLYKIISSIKENDVVVDRLETDFGFRTVNWKNTTNQFFINGKAVFLDGIAEYEHLIGNSHAFSEEQIRARALQMKAVGFNAFRDAHQPHNLRYQQYWDSLGVAWWTQLSAHVWYDSPKFRQQFKQLLKEWVIERRNSPSLVLWGLQNESKIPEDFARECTELIRSLDPTASSQRLVTTCNGGSGTDWDVPQNWTGTYGGNPLTYANDLKRQILIGEYGAWRTLDLHVEGADFAQATPYSEDRMVDLMELKVRLSQEAKDSSAGQFFWLYTSHDNPGRVQGGEGLRELDRIGPVNYKGLLTPWEEPLDVYYMFRANYASKITDPMVHIVSHTWPDRWTSPGIVSNIKVYSNCDEVELRTDERNSFGKRKNAGIGKPFRWDNVNLSDNILIAVGFVNGKVVCADTLLLKYLPQGPLFGSLYHKPSALLTPQPGYQYLYRVNCGGRNFTDHHGKLWLADKPISWTANAGSEKYNFGSVNWTNDFPGMPSFFASQRQTNDVLHNANDWALFQDFRYGRDKLKYVFKVPDGEYSVELYFIEPWWGRGTGTNAGGYRVFDVAVNDQVVLKDLDIWKEVGHGAVLKKTVKALSKGGKLEISFPHTKVGQAVISAIAVAGQKISSVPALSKDWLIKDLLIDGKQFPGKYETHAWLHTADKLNGDQTIFFKTLPPALYGSAWITSKHAAYNNTENNMEFGLEADADVYLAIEEEEKLPAGYEGFEDNKMIIETTGAKKVKLKLYRRRFSKKEKVRLPVIASNIVSSIIVQEAANIEPAYDLKAVTSYKAIDANFTGAAVKAIAVNDKENVVISSDAASTVRFNVSFGVADIYSLTIKYNNPTNKNWKGVMEFLSADGTLMKKENIEFTPTRPGKWNYINTNTGSMINAGHYFVVVKTEGTPGLVVSSVDVQ